MIYILIFIFPKHLIMRKNITKEGTSNGYKVELSVLYYRGQHSETFRTAVNKVPPIAEKEHYISNVLI